MEKQLGLAESIVVMIAADCILVLVVVHVPSKLSKFGSTQVRTIWWSVPLPSARYVVLCEKNSDQPCHHHHHHNRQQKGRFTRLSSALIGGNCSLCGEGFALAEVSFGVFIRCESMQQGFIRVALPLCATRTCVFTLLLRFHVSPCI